MSNRNFIDPDTSDSFLGNPPFVHWYVGPRSIGLFHPKTIMFYSSTERVDVRVSSAGVFKLYNPSGIHRLRHIPPHPPEDTSHDVVENETYYEDPTETLASKIWHTIESVTADSVTSVGIKKDGCYIHKVTFIARADEEGEYIDDFFIDDERYQIGIELRDEDESLRVELENKGCEIPPQFTKAIYQGDVLDDSIDWVLVNNKRRELLNNYSQTLMNKASYMSLYDSLRWFGWGSEVDLREVWQHQTERGMIYEDTPVHQIFDDRLSELLSTRTKTTYLVLRTKSDRWIWEEPEIRLKMYLLAHFFEVYFMPIHLDVILSAVEHLQKTPDLMVDHYFGPQEHGKVLWVSSKRF